MTAIGKAIYQARLAKGWTQATLAQRVGVSQATVANWENGHADPYNYQKELTKALGPLPFDPSDFDADEVPALDSSSLEFGDWVRTEREKKDWSRAELAARAKVSVPTIHNIEGGKSLNPQKLTRDRISEALGTVIPAAIVTNTEQEQAIEGLGSLVDFDPHDKDNWPQCSGIYILYDVSERPVYIGRSKNIYQRLSGHTDKFWFKAPIVQNGAYIEVVEPTLLHQLEQVLIKALKSNAIINRQSVEGNK